jgi:hypothetical protein
MMLSNSLAPSITCCLYHMLSNSPASLISCCCTRLHVPSGAPLSQSHAVKQPSVLNLILGE